MTSNATEKLFSNLSFRPSDVDVVELHDCFSANELITYEALGLCAPGKAGELIDKGDNTYGGKYVINPSGGLISKGHPLGATGLAQCTELCWQLRGQAGKRQVPGAKLGRHELLSLFRRSAMAQGSRILPYMEKTLSQLTGPTSIFIGTSYFIT
jgi:sterol carrier protein 2